MISQNVAIQNAIRLLTTVKQLLSEALVLKFPNFFKDFVVRVDAHEAGAGAFLA